MHRFLRPLFVSTSLAHNETIGSRKPARQAVASENATQRSA
jgi:hypothetical protein